MGHFIIIVQRAIIFNRFVILMQREIDILLIVNNREQMFFIQSIVDNIGGYHSFNVAESGEEALTYLHRVIEGKYRLPELILLDCDAIGEGEFNVIDFVKSSAALRCAPVVVFCPSENEAHVRKVYELNANCYILKPADKEKQKKLLEGICQYWLTTARLYCSELTF